jgi:acetyltransferase-like isoleucine patch superfamily enzyme
LIDKGLREDSKELADRRRVFAGTHSWENNVNEIYLSVDRVMKVREVNTSLPLTAQTGLKTRIKANPRLQKWVMWFISPRRRPRPRWYIRLIFNRFVHKRGKHSLIRTPSRMDLFPYNKFELGDDSTIESFCVVNNGAGDVIIGSKAIIGIGSVVIGPVNMGKGSGLGQNVFVSGFNHGYKDGTRNSSEQPLDLRPVLIGEDSHIGANAVVLAGVKIGKRCQIGAGSVVSRDIPDFSIAVGNPARVIKRFNPVSGQWEKSDNLNYVV